MPARATVETVFTGNDAPLAQTIKSAEQRAKTFAGRVENLFQFRGERRVAKGTGLFGAQILAAQSGVDVLEASVLGLANTFKVGFGATIGVIAGVAIFNKLKGSIEETRKSYEALSVDLNKPVEVQSRLDVEGIGEQIADLQKKEDQLLEHSNSTAQQIVKLFQGKIFGNVKDEARGAVDAAADRIEKLQAAQGKASQRAVGAEEVAATQGEHAGELAKIHAKFDAERAKVELTPRFEPGRADKLDAINRAEALATKLSDDKARQKQDELELENRILSIKESGLTKDQRDLSIQRAKVQALQDQLSKTTNPDERARISTQLRGATDDLSISEYAHRNDLGSAAYTPERAAEAAYKAWKAERERKMRQPSWEQLFPMRPVPPGRKAAQDVITGRGNTDNLYGSVGLLGYDAKTNLSDWGVPKNNITAFGSGSFMDVRQNAADKFRQRFNTETPPDVAGRPDSGLQAMAMAFERAFDAIMGKYWK